MDSIKIKEITEKLRACLDEERFLHTLGVAEKARELAENFGEDADKGYLAGLLHDCAKCFSKEDLFRVMSENSVELGIDECEFLNPKTYHAPVGAIVAKESFGIQDKEILSSIRWHTLGRVNMSNFEKIVYLADKIEEKTRPQEYREPIEKLLNQENGLDNAILETYRLTIKSLVDRNLMICPNTIDVYNSLLKNLN